MPHSQSKTQNYYELLGIATTASPAEIRKARGDLTKKYHPDINQSPDATAKMKEINEAATILLDAQQRQLYDRYGSTLKPADKAPSPKEPSPQASYKSGPGVWDFFSRSAPSQTQKGEPEAQKQPSNFLPLSNRKALTNPTHAALSKLLLRLAQIWKPEMLIIGPLPCMLPVY